jgi:hypothetical protein
MQAYVRHVSTAAPRGLPTFREADRTGHDPGFDVMRVDRRRAGRGQSEPHAQRRLQCHVSTAAIASERATVYFQAGTRVRQNTHSKKTFPTSTLIRGVQLTP